MKGKSANFSAAGVGLMYAAALGMRGDVAKAQTALSQFFELQPNLNSFTRLSAGYVNWDASPSYIALRQKTIDVGLRRAGLPRE